MQSDKKEVQKKNELKGGLNSSKKFDVDVNIMRGEKQKDIDKDIDSNEQGSTSITEEKKKNEEKPKFEENHGNSTKTAVNPKNEDKKIVDNPPFSPNNINGVRNPQIFNEIGNIFSHYIKQKMLFQTSIQRAFNCLANPNNVNHYLLNPNYYLFPQNQLLPYNFNVSNNIINNFSNNINPLYNNNCFQYPIINSLSNGIFFNNNIFNPENYTITFKSKTNDPTIEKISKITIKTSYKDNSAAKQNNKETVKKYININDILSGKEKRTVVRLNPIPKKFLILDIIKLLDSHLKPERNKRIYKALYVPYSKGKEKNLGYCFIMMASPRHVVEIYNAFNGKVFGKKKNQNPSKVIWADKQGDEFLKLNEDDVSRKPVVFSDCCVD